MADENEKEPGLIQRMINQRNEWAEDRPSFGAELKAMAREGLKDIRTSVNEVFFNSPEYGGEPGTPLNPTPQMVTQDLGTVHGSYEKMLDAYASRADEQDQQNHRGMDR